MSNHPNESWRRLQKPRIHPGTDWEALMPLPDGSSTIQRGATLNDTMAQLPEVIEEFAWQTERIAPSLRGRTIRETARNIHRALYGRYQYHPDPPGIELIRSPARAFAERFRGIDCDCFAVTAGCILRNLGIGFRLRIVKYPDPNDPNPDYSHIFIVVGREEIILDPVLSRFDYQPNYTDKIDINMDLQVLNGPPNGGAMDARDLFGGGALAGKADRVDDFVAGLVRAGKLPPNPTPEQIKAYRRAEFIRQHGKTPEEYAAEQEAIRRDQKASQVDRTGAEALEAELRRRGVAFASGLSRNELLALLNRNPATGPGGKVANVVNRTNPATVLLRTGILVAMKINQFGIAERLRWTLYAGHERAKAAGFTQSATVWNHLAKVKSKLDKTYIAAGGKREALNKAIIEGRGNQRGEVSLAGVRSWVDLKPGEILGSELYREATGTTLAGPLGEPVSTSAALAAASAVLGVIAGLVKKRESEIKEAATQEALDNLGTEDGAAGSGGGREINLDTANRETDPNTPDEPGAFQRFTNWVKDNPLKSLGIGVGGGALAFLGFKAYQKSRTGQGEAALAGPPPNPGKTPSGKPLVWKKVPKPSNLRSKTSGAKKRQPRQGVLFSD